MFTRYKYTCPDVIHMRHARRRNTIITVVAYTVLSAVGYVWAVAVTDNIVENLEKEDEK